MSDDALSEQFKALYTQWGDAIANKDHAYLEDLFTGDFLGTAQPWPSLIVNKAQMIELDKAIEAMETEWVKVTAHKVGAEVITIGLVRYHKEEFRDGAAIAEGMPSGSDIAALTHGKVAIYCNGWRHNGERWQIFDHHMVGLARDEGF
ncbi:hypothetical protein [Novosphingobium album (ex Hu et al. 2023)]|uniref:SnoaL-like domain-containing protein n=1 Tax=Novosphingobium album (ex Hu et al. 2023) TaxID=2930093 RepID=A0ABT0B7B3_9SPHN|nr:hypothetical protein [Novosphingobium album (ex Hu et al. 2023)]MCJ2180955.1 hypothetical protein [Novosphingobium album (ex Hu et al. 2023)]